MNLRIECGSGHNRDPSFRAILERVLFQMVILKITRHHFILFFEPDIGHWRVRHLRSDERRSFEDQKNLKLGNWAVAYCAKGHTEQMA